MILDTVTPQSPSRRGVRRSALCTAPPPAAHCRVSEVEPRLTEAAAAAPSAAEQLSGGDSVPRDT